MLHQVRRLSEPGDGNLGLACTAEGLVLGRTLLIERRDGRFVMRGRAEIERLLDRAYRAELPLDRLMSGLANVAIALNANDPCLARIAAVHLRIPDLPDLAAREDMEVADSLIKSGDWNPALHPRAGTPPNAGWFAPTEGAEESSSIRTAQRNDRGWLTNASQGRSRPGDRFSTAGAAAIAALLSVYGITHAYRHLRREQYRLFGPRRRILYAY